MIENGTLEGNRLSLAGGGQAGESGEPDAPGVPRNGEGSAPPKDGGGPGLVGMSPFEAAIARINEALMSELRTQQDSSPAELKSALRSYINMLEEMYQRI